MDKPKKPEFFCEECGFQSDQLYTVKKHFLFCKDCAEAHKRRERFKKEEDEWNRGVGQKEND
jgi:hypothetical protein